MLFNLKFELFLTWLFNSTNTPNNLLPTLHLPNPKFDLLSLSLILISLFGSGVLRVTRQASNPIHCPLSQKTFLTSLFGSAALLSHYQNLKILLYLFIKFKKGNSARRQRPWARKVFVPQISDRMVPKIIKFFGKNNSNWLFSDSLLWNEILIMNWRFEPIFAKEHQRMMLQLCFRYFKCNILMFIILIRRKV